MEHSNSNQKPISEHLGAGIYQYDETNLGIVVRVIVTVVASVLPLCSIIVLYVIQANGLRLGLIVIQSVIFSLALCLMTNARMIEIFAATSA